MGKFDFKKGASSLKDVAAKAGEKLSVVAKDGAQILSEKKQEISDKAQEKNYELRMKKYNPLFPEVYLDSEFKLPNMIRIVDDICRKGIDVCEGAIGWLSNENDMEVMHLYEDAIELKNIRFFPNPTCDGVYYVDPHNQNVYINIDTYFSNMQQERLAELQHIAYSLGAREYSVEMIETTSDFNSTDVSASAKVLNKNSVDVSDSKSQSTSTYSKTAAKAVFGSGRTPVEPTLSWFVEDKNIIALIKMRCSGADEEGLSTYSFELNNSCAQSMSSVTAAKIDLAIKGLGAKTNFNSESEKEHSRKMIFHIDF